MALLLIVQAARKRHQFVVQLLNGGAARVVFFNQLLKLFSKVGAGAVDLHHLFQLGADGGFKHLKLGVFVFRLLKPLRQCLKVDFRQIQRRRCVLAYLVARNRHIKQAANLPEHLRNIWRVGVEAGFYGFGQRSKAGNAAGKLQRQRVGLYGAVQRTCQPLVGKKITSYGFGRNQRVYAIVHVQQAFHAACVQGFNLCQQHTLRGAKGSCIGYRLAQLLQQLLFILYRALPVFACAVNGQRLLQ